MQTEVSVRQAYMATITVKTLLNDYPQNTIWCKFWKVFID